MLRNVGRLLALRNFVEGRNGCRSTSKSFSTSRRTNSALTITLDSQAVENENKERWKLEFKERLRKHKLDDLLESLGRERPNPSRTWGYYLDALQSVGVDKIPPDLHVSTLYKCVPDAKQLRIATARRMQARNFPKNPHLFEERIMAVMKNIRRAGGCLEVEDYHFILDQYAAVGHYMGALNILKDMEQFLADVPTRSYGLCLKAVAHRLSLPYPPDDELRIRSECSNISAEILRRMATAGKEITPIILGFTLRILKDSRDADAFETLLKSAYGIDLSFPDRYLFDDNSSNSYHPISTATLTTIVDFFGREKLISKMVVAFEVLSNPLPDRSAVYDEDEEEYIPSISTPPFPTAQPNISTYIAMIRRCAFSRRTVLAKHYLLEVLDKDRVHDARLRHDLAHKPAIEVLRPTVSVNRAVFIPIIGLANRHGDVSLIRWLLGVYRNAYRQKRADMEYYSSLLKGPHSPASSTPPQSASLKDTHADILDANSEASSTFFTSNPPDDASTFHVLDVDLESKAPSSPSARQPFDLKFHVDLLRRDLYELHELDAAIARCYTRLCDRTREALDRRVERGQGIYLRHEDDRMVVDEAHWKQIRDATKDPRKSQRKEVINGVAPS